MTPRLSHEIRDDSRFHYRPTPNDFQFTMWTDFPRGSGASAKLPTTPDASSGTDQGRGSEESILTPQATGDPGPVENPDSAVQQ